MTGNNEASRRRPDALDRLESKLAWGAKALPRTRVSGVVTEIAMSHYRVAGLSEKLRQAGHPIVRHRDFSDSENA